jgi:hypothetical protein
MSQFPGYSDPPPPPHILPDDAPPNLDAPWPTTDELPRVDFERAAYQDMAKFRRLGKWDSAVSAVTFGGDNMRLNYALLGVMLGAMVMFGVWWVITE